MNIHFKKLLRPLLFTLGGGIVGLAYYGLVGCNGGGCFISSNPVISMVYVGLIGWLLSGLFGKGCEG